MSNEDSKIPQPWAEMSRQTKRFVEGVQRLEFPDDRGIAVATAATRFTRLIDGVIEAAVAPTLTDESVMTDVMTERVVSAMDRLEQLVTLFREDAAAGNTRLPDMNDLAIGLAMFGKEPDELVNALELMSIEKTLEPSAERTALIECLTGVGVPVAEVGIQPPVLIKSLLTTVLTLLAKTDPKLQPLVIRTMAALTAIDRMAQDAPATVGDGPVVGVGPRISGDVNCGDSFIIKRLVEGSTPNDATNDAFRDAIKLAGGRCRSGCIPIRTNTRLYAEFEFRCVSPAG